MMIAEKIRNFLKKHSNEIELDKCEYEVKDFSLEDRLKKLTDSKSNIQTWFDKYMDMEDSLAKFKALDYLAERAFNMFYFTYRDNGHKDNQESDFYKKLSFKIQNEAESVLRRFKYEKEKMKNEV